MAHGDSSNRKGLKQRQHTMKSVAGIKDTTTIKVGETTEMVGMMGEQ